LHAAAASCDDPGVRDPSRPLSLGQGWARLLWALVVGMTLLAAPVAHARREQTFGYPYSRVWTTAVRLLRVDFEAHITEKDKDDGYFLFEYPDRGKVYSGSCELVAVKQDDAEAVRVVITIQALPSYVENMIMDRLGRKLEQEFGAPHEAKPKKPSEPGKDGDDAPAEPERPKVPANKGRPADRPLNRDDGSS
jgi:hypothetical protein